MWRSPLPLALVPSSNSLSFQDLEGRAVVARYEMRTETIPVGQSVTVSIFRSVEGSTSVEGRFRDQPARFSTRAAIDQIDWGQAVDREEPVQ